MLISNFLYETERHLRTFSQMSSVSILSKDYFSLNIKIVSMFLWLTVVFDVSNVSFLFLVQWLGTPSVILDIVPAGGT